MDRRSELVDVIREVRSRWRRRLALRGIVVVAAGTILVLLLSASGLQSLRFSAPAIIGFRLIAAAVFLGLAYLAFVRPMRRRVSDSQVAMYLEESNPQLEAAIISAIEATRAPDPTGALGAASSASPRLVERLVEQAIEQCRAIDHRQSADGVAFRRHAAALVGVGLLAALVIALGPAYLRHGLSALLILSRSAEASSPYHIQVTPGNAKVPKGADQIVRAKLIGFDSRDVGIMMRTAPGAAFERVPLVPVAAGESGKSGGSTGPGGSAGSGGSKGSGGSPGSAAPATTAANETVGLFEGMLFHLEKETEYYVESNGVLSPRFKLEVVDLPTVERLDLEYHFPAYTNLAPRQVEGGGDVAAIRGTDVRLHITPTMKTPGGRILLNDGGDLPLTAQEDGTLTGGFPIKEQGFYRIELTGPHGEKVDASPQYTIDVIDDQPPSVKFSKPGRDTQASPVEELFLEARADDDYGVKQLQLFYSANGAPPKTVTLFGGSKPLAEVSAGHTIYLEELGLKPGDFVSYYAKATDTDTVAGPKTATSDIYFVQIRPFRKDYKPVQSQAMGGGGGGQQNNVGQLSQQQREIVAATFNAVRDKAKTKPDKYRENVVFLNLAQAKLREQVEELVGKLEARLGNVDEGFNKIAGLLPQAASEMKAAEGQLKAMKPDDALSPEQKALKILQDAEQQYEVQVAMQQGGGGGGGGQNAMAEDLADLFELELDKLANQYEMQNRAEQQSSDQQIDALVEKLKELARRQQQEIERQRRLAQQSSSSGGSGGASQRQLAEELEKAERQLQQLTRDQQQQQNVADAMRRMQQAADAMRRAAANGSSDGAAQATEALARLREAQQKLERDQGGRGQRDLQNAQRQADELAAEQKQIQSEVNGLGQAGAGKADKTQQLAQRKDAMDAKVADLQKQLEELANQVRRDEHDAARKLDEAAGSIRDNRIREKIRYSRNALNGGASEYARGVEESLTSNLDALSRKIGDASAAMGKQAKQDAVGRAAEKARDLVRGMESMDQRLRDRAQQGSQAKGNQNGRGSQNGENSQGSQSAQGSQGSQSASGQSADGQNGGSQANGGPRGGAYGGDGRNWGGGYWGGPWYGGYGYYNPDDIRQFRRDFREWANDAEALRRQLQASGINTRELDDIIRDLQRFDTDRVYADPRGLEQLQAAASEKLKKFEFSLRRKAEADSDSLSLSGSDQVPEGFRQAIEEYYRSLARKR